MDLLRWLSNGRDYWIIGHRSVASPLTAEALAMREALNQAISLGLHSLEAFTDNSTLVRAINGNAQYKEIIGIIADIRSISSGFASFSISYFPRSQNVIADGLAKQALQAFSSSLY